MRSKLTNLFNRMIINGMRISFFMFEETMNREIRISINQVNFFKFDKFFVSFNTNDFTF